MLLCCHCSIVLVGFFPSWADPTLLKLSSVQFIVVIHVYDFDVGQKQIYLPSTRLTLHDEYIFDKILDILPKLFVTKALLTHSSCFRVETNFSIRSNYIFEIIIRNI